MSNPGTGSVFRRRSPTESRGHNSKIGVNFSVAPTLEESMRNRARLPSHHGRPQHQSYRSDYPQQGVDPPESDVVTSDEQGKDISGSNGVHRRVQHRYGQQASLRAVEQASQHY